MAISITLHSSAAGICSLTPCTTILRLPVPSIVDSSIGFFPVHSPLLRESQLFSCPPLNDPCYLPRRQHFLCHLRMASACKSRLRWPEGVDCTLNKHTRVFTHALAVVEAATVCSITQSLTCRLPPRCKLITIGNGH